MSGITIDKLPHSCGTSKGLQVYANPDTGQINGWCFACSKFVANPYGVEKTVDDVELPEPKTEAQIKAEIAEISGYATVDVKSRKLRKRYLEKFDIKIALSEEDGRTPEVMYFPMWVEGKQTGYYAKTINENKVTWSLGEVKNAEPFG